MNGLLRILASLSLLLVVNDARGQFGRPPVRVPPPRTPIIPRTTPVVPRTTPITPPATSQTQPGTRHVDASTRASGFASAASTVGLAGLPQGPLLAASSLAARQAEGDFRVPELTDKLVIWPQPQRSPLEPNLLVAQQRNPPGPGQQTSSSDVGVWIVVAGVGLALLLGIAVVMRNAGSARRFGRGRIRIVAMPPGDAPEHIRRAWVGLELPLANGQSGPSRQPAQGILSGQDEGPCSGYAVDGREGVALLAAKAPEAAAWWRQQAPHVTTHGYQLVFPADVCEQVG
jgi:hypothetical protein